MTPLNILMIEMKKNYPSIEVSYLLQIKDFL